MAGAKGYANIKKLVFLGLALGESGVKAARAETRLGKAAAFLSAADEAVDLLGVDLDELELEWSDWSAEDKADLLDECKAEFDLEDEGLEQRIEVYLGIGLDFVEVISRAVTAHQGEGAA